MTDFAVTAASPVLPRAETSLRPVAARLEGGLLSDWQRRNIEATIPHSIAKLSEYGHVGNFERLATGEQRPFAGFVFSDSDVHKELEGIAWTPRGVPDNDAFFDRMVDLFTAVQAGDGYLNTAFQGWDAKQRAWSDFPQGHELYTLGHLIQAGIAARRHGRGDRLLDVARRFADLAVALFCGDEHREVPGHPGIEMALVELYRETGEPTYLELAREFVERRGSGWLGAAPHGPYYYQDVVPLRETHSLHGHAVRAVYLCAGAADVAIETGDRNLLGHLDSLWDDMVATKSYVTGGIGSRHRDEAFGDAYELPSERAYAETCAAIGLVQWAWRMLLATGDPKYADHLERVMLNAYPVGLSEDGRAFFYSNPLQRRRDHLPSQEEGAGERLSWFSCSCCPPNIARTMATLHTYLATQDATGVQVHLPAAATLEAQAADGSPIAFHIEGDYPWQAQFTITIERTPTTPWTLRFRLPAGAVGPTIDGQPTQAPDGYASLHRVWAVGDSVTISAELPVRQVYAHPHVDALRGATAVMRGPLVYCAEEVDNTADLDNVALGEGGSSTATAEDGKVTVAASGVEYERPPATLYPTTPVELGGRPTIVRLIPYFAWGNRDLGTMRVWFPAASGAVQ